MKLTLSTKYVRHWGLWEAVRELLQNAYDQRDRTGCEVEMSLNGRGTLRISTSDGELPRSSLLLGESDKRDGERGSFGEGYKLAMLVLTRMGRKVTVYNGRLKWEPRIVFDPEFGCEVLEIVESELAPWEPGVSFLVDGVDENEWAEILGNVTETGPVLTDGDPGRVFVGGLFVCRRPEFQFSYNLPASVVRLDRDRQAVDGFNLSAATSTIWAQRAQEPVVYEMVKDRKPDVEFLCNRDRKAHEALARAFVAEHGDAVPVSDQDEILLARERGLKSVLVPQALRDMIEPFRGAAPRVRRETPRELLARFLQEHDSRLTDVMRSELEKILEVI